MYDIINFVLISADGADVSNWIMPVDLEHAPRLVKGQAVYIHEYVVYQQLIADYVTSDGVNVRVYKERE